MSCVTWSLIVIFALGIANFTLHRAVLESGNPIVEQLPSVISVLGARLTLVAEFLLLLAALLLAANGWSGLVWAYLAYSLLNSVTAWLILSNRI